MGIEGVICGDDEVFSRGDEGVRWEGKIDAHAKGRQREVVVHRASIEEFDKGMIISLGGRGVVVEFVDDKLLISDAGKIGEVLKYRGECLIGEVVL